MIAPSVNRCETPTLHTAPLNIPAFRGSLPHFIVRVLGCEGCEGCSGHLSREGTHTRTLALDSSANTLHTLHTGWRGAKNGRESTRDGKVGVKGCETLTLHGGSQEVVCRGE